MPEVSGSEFFKANAAVEKSTREFKLADDQNRHITVELEEVERKDLFNELHRLPSGFIDVMLSGGVDDLEDVDDPEDVDLDVDPSELINHIDGNTIDVFESLFAISANHPDLTSMDMEELSTSLSFEVLFEVGGEVIDLSLADNGRIKRFREPDSDKSS